MKLASDRSFRHLAGIVLTSVLLVGAVCHFEHHLLDPHCGASTSHESQPCATCAGLHGAAAAVESDLSAHAVLVPIADVAGPDSPPATARPVFAGNPRAPPIA